MQFRITGESLDQPWEGSIEELVEGNLELPELVLRRLETLQVGETIRPPVGDDTFEITRVG